MPTITSPRPSFVSHIASDASASPSQIGKTFPLTGAANAPRGSTASTFAATSLVSAGYTTPSNFTFDEAFPLNYPARDNTQSIDASKRDAMLFPPEPKPTLGARFNASFVLASRKLLMNQMCNDWYEKQTWTRFQEHPQSAPGFLKTAAKELAGILTTLDNDTQWKTNDKQRHHVKNQLSETVKNALYGPGKLSVKQRFMLYALPEIKRSVVQFNEDFSYAKRDISSSRRLLFTRTLDVVMAFDARVARTEKLLIDTYIQDTHRAVSGEFVSALVDSEIVGRVLERTAGLGIEQQREVAVDEIQRVWETLERRRSDAAHLSGSLARVNNTPSRPHIAAVPPPKPPRAAPRKSVVTQVSAPTSASVSTQTPPPEQSHPPRSESLAHLQCNFPNYANAQAQAQDTAASPNTMLPLTETQAHHPDRPIGRTPLGTLMAKFRSFFTAARKRCTPDWESRTMGRQWQAQRLAAASVAYDKIIDQAAAIVHALDGRNDGPIGSANGNGNGEGHANVEQRIAGAARATMLRTGKLTLDLGRQLSLHPLLSASDSHTLQLAATYDMDAIHALETGGRLRADQRGLLYGLSALVHALEQLPSSLKQPGSNVGAKFVQANIALSRLLILQNDAHDKLTRICVRANLSSEERAAIFNDRTVAHLMELISGQPEDQHMAICWRMVVEARQALQDPEPMSMC